MARPAKQGLSYFPYDIGFIRDRQFRQVKMKYGFMAVGVYLGLLEMIYGEQGYYVEYSDRTKDDVIWEIQEALQGKYQPDANTVAEVIEDLTACGLFSDDRFKEQILTSKRIQATYYAATVERSTVSIDFSKWLLTYEEMVEIKAKSHILQSFEIFRRETVVYRRKTGVFPDNNLQSKEKESKLNNKEREEKNDGQAVERARAFKKPTIEEIRTYCEERGNGIDFQHFNDYYEANGWKIGKTPMKDWRAAVRNWEARETARPQPSKRHNMLANERPKGEVVVDYNSLSDLDDIL